MTPDAYIEWLKSQLLNATHRAMATTAGEVRRRVRNEIPSNRIKTRKALRYRLRRSGSRIEARITLQFSQNYNSNNTQTERIMRAAWTRQRPNTGPIFFKALSDEIRRM